MSDIRSIPVNSLVRRDDARMQDEAAVWALAESIANTGLMNPLTVRPLTDDRFEIIAGSHRFTACDMLEWPEISCHVVALDDTLAELAMIDENLCRAELKGALRDQQTARRKAIYEALHPETRHGANAADAAASRWLDASRQVGDTHSAEPNDAKESTTADRFTAETAALTGQSERTIQRSAERGEKISPEAASLMAGTRLDTGSYADRIKNRPAAEQVETVRRDLAAPTRPPVARHEPTPARAASKPKPEPGEAFRRFIELVDEIESIGVRDILAAAGSQRSVLGQRASGLADVLEDIMRGCS